MKPGILARSGPECAVCLGPHDDEFHRSTKRILRWLVARSVMAPLPVIVPRTFAPGLANVAELRSPASRRKAAGK